MTQPNDTDSTLGTTENDTPKGGSQNFRSLTQNTDDLCCGGTVVYSRLKRWRGKFSPKSRTNQLNYHTGGLVGALEAQLPKGTVFVIAIKGDVNTEDAQASAVALATAEMPHAPAASGTCLREDPKWEGCTAVNGWLILEWHVV